MQTVNDQTVSPIATGFWAIVEVMGKTRYAGFVTEQVVAGAHFLRVDVPDVPGQKGFTKLLAPSSLFAVTPAQEDIVRAVATQDRVRPLNEYDLPEEWRKSIRILRSRTQERAMVARGSGDLWDHVLGGEEEE